MNDSNDAEHDSDYDKFKVDLVSPSGTVFVVKGKSSGHGNIIKSVRLKPTSVEKKYKLTKSDLVSIIEKISGALGDYTLLDKLMKEYE